MALPADFSVRLRRAGSRLGPFACGFRHCREVGSTNDVVARLAGLGAPHGTVVVADTQTAGRGRHGNSWFSPPGSGLYLSALIRTSSSPVLTLATGVAVAEALRKTSVLDATLKWPNDVVVSLSSGNPLKVAGILAETSTVLGFVDYVIVGIGINLTDAAWPAGLIGRVGSVEGLTGRSVDPAVLLVELLASLARRCDDVESGRIADLLKVWEVLAPSSRGAEVEWSVGKVRHRGITEGIDKDGALLVRVGSRLERLIGGQVQQVR